MILYEWTVFHTSTGLNPDRIEKFQDELRRCLSDPNLLVKQGDKGAAILVVKSSGDAFLRMGKRIQDSGPTGLEVGGILISAITDAHLTNLNEEVVAQEIPTDLELSHTTRPLPKRVSLPSDLPIEIPGEDEYLIAIQREQLRNARWSFNVGLLLGIIGFGVGIYIVGSWGASASRNGIGISISVIMEFLTFFLIRIHDQMNRRLDEAQKEVRARSREHNLFLKLLRINDIDRRDEAIIRFIEAALIQTASDADKLGTIKSKSARK